MTIESDYREAFGLGSGDDADLHKAEKALTFALDIRKFEISLYWQRTAYFWALMAAAFAGYFAISNSANPDESRKLLAFIVSCIGSVFGLAWYLVNRGSKFWQENWENHVDMLEDQVIGPLYKTILLRPRTGPAIDRYFLGPLPISVSKINLIVSMFCLGIWLVLVSRSISGGWCDGPNRWSYISTIAITLAVALFMFFGAKTHMGAHNHQLFRRQTGIDD